MVNFPIWIPDCNFHSPALLGLFLMMLVFVLQWLSLHWKILIMLLSQYPLTFHQTTKQDALFHCIAYDHSCTDWDGLCDHLRHVPWEDIFNSSVSAAARELCDWVQAEIGVHISNHKYQVKPHSFLWF